jgi:hypothetical protein
MVKMRTRKLSSNTIMSLTQTKDDLSVGLRTEIFRLHIYQTQWIHKTKYCGWQNKIQEALRIPEIRGWWGLCCFYIRPTLLTLPISYSKKSKIALLTFILRSRDSAVGTAIDYALDGQGVGVRVPVGTRIFCSFRPALGPTQPPNQCYTC